MSVLAPGAIRESDEIAKLKLALGHAPDAMG